MKHVIFICSLCLWAFNVQCQQTAVTPHPDSLERKFLIYSVGVDSKLVEKYFSSRDQYFKKTQQIRGKTSLTPVQLANELEKAAKQHNKDVLDLLGRENFEKYILKIEQAKWKPNVRKHNPKPLASVD